MSPVETMMREWLDSGTPAQKFHAEHRLAKDFPEFAEAIASRVRRLPPGSLCLHAPLTSWTGHGQLAYWMGRALERHRIPFGYLSRGTVSEYQPPDPFVLARQIDWVTPGGWMVSLDIPEGKPLDGHPTVAWTMWESSRISRRGVDCLNECRAVIVPNRWNLEGFRESGVTVPIYQVPLGVDPSVYRPQPWPEGPFTVLMVARPAHGGSRKGLEDGLRAFGLAFPDHKDVRLIIKVHEDDRERGLVATVDDPRITVLAKTLSAADMVALYGSCHALLVPAKGEGWGLNSHWAMACSRPILACRYGGTAEFFDGTCGWELPFEERPAEGYYEGLGHYAFPTDEGMVEALREAESDRAECQRRGAAAAKRAAEFSWEHSGVEFARVLREVGAVAPKVRGIDAAAKAKRECIPCQQKKVVQP